jgi:hypothetical protein
MHGTMPWQTGLRGPSSGGHRARPRRRPAGGGEPLKSSAEAAPAPMGHTDSLEALIWTHIRPVPAALSTHWTSPAEALRDPIIWRVW